MAKRSSDVVVDHVRSTHDVLLNCRTATEVVLALVRRSPVDGDLRVEVRGRDLLTGLPRTIVLTKFELRDAIRAS